MRPAGGDLRFAQSEAPRWRACGRGGCSTGRPTATLPACGNRVRSKPCLRTSGRNASRCGTRSRPYSAVPRRPGEHQALPRQAASRRLLCTVVHSVAVVPGCRTRFCESPETPPPHAPPAREKRVCGRRKSTAALRPPRGESMRGCFSRRSLRRERLLAHFGPRRRRILRAVSWRPGTEWTLTPAPGP